MKPYRVKITSMALGDMEAIHRYIAVELQAPDAAWRQYDRIADAVASLATAPKRCPLFDAPPERDRGIRQRLVDHYTVIFVVDDDADTVTVLRVLYSASDINARLREGR